MNTKLRVAILFGGKSAEHEISLISAMNIISALDRNRFEPVLIGVSKLGKWFLQEESRFMAQGDDPKTVKLTDFDEPLALLPGEGDAQLLHLGHGGTLPRIDAVFSILHGPYGEDGTMQGLLRQLNLPFVGPGVLGSAAAMDKDVAKRMLTQAGIPNARFCLIHRHERDQFTFESLKKDLGLPMFIKPANMGSSVGISKVETAEELMEGLNEAFRYDVKVLVEEFIDGREIEVAVLGNEEVRASVPGEIIPVDGWYDYEAKYINAEAAKLEAPARGMSPADVAHIQELAVRAFRALELEGLSRVDFFLQKDGKLLINEINTLPGFTKISMYPRLWGLSGIPYTQLITELIELGIARHQRETGLLTTRIW
ncbi:MAG: D-alanine--D-alanine ligase [Bacteroidia bacterium]|nr:D-alanine--D-alanine ligase [Bacteroidia bacterium]